MLRLFSVEGEVETHLQDGGQGAEPGPAPLAQLPVPSPGDLPEWGGGSTGALSACVPCVCASCSQGAWRRDAVTAFLGVE